MFYFRHVTSVGQRNMTWMKGSSEKKAWKNSGLYGIWTHDLCDTGAALYQLS